MRKRIYKILFWYLKTFRNNDWYIFDRPKTCKRYKTGDFVYDYMNNHKVIWWYQEEYSYYYLAVITSKKRRY